LFILLKPCPAFNFLQQLVTVIYTYTCSPSFSIDVVASLQTTDVFADSRIGLLCHALRICAAHVPPESCPSFLLVHKALRTFHRNLHHYCTTTPCHKIKWFKHPFRGRRFEHLNDSFCALISLIFLYPQKILIPVRGPFKLYDVYGQMILVNHYAIRPSISKTIFIKRLRVEIMAFSLVLCHKDRFFNYCSLCFQRFSAAYLLKPFLQPPRRVHTTLLIRCNQPELTR